MLNVLIADSHALNRMGIRSIFSGLEEDFEFQDVENFDEAKNLATTAQIIVLDLDLPGLGQMAGLKELRNTNSNLKVIVMSARPETEAILAAMMVGIHGFIFKDADSKDMMMWFRRVMNGEIVVPYSVCEGATKKQVVEHALVATQLTERQSAVLKLMKDGKSNKEIARSLGICEGTVKVHVAGLFRNLGVHNRISAINAYETRISAH